MYEERILEMDLLLVECLVCFSWRNVNRTKKGTSILSFYSLTAPLIEIAPSKLIPHRQLGEPMKIE